MKYSVSDGVTLVVMIIVFTSLILILILSVGFYDLQDKQENFNSTTTATTTTAALAAIDTDYPESAPPPSKGPVIKYSNLKAEVVFKGLSYSTDMAFLDQNDILVIEKDTGIVRRIVNGTMLQKPLLDVNVATQGHRGMLGIAVSNISSSSLDREINNNTTTQESNTNITKYVFLYYTAATPVDGEDITEGKQPLGNVVYRYEFVNDKLVNPKLLLELPATPGSIGNGGKILVGPDDDNVYVTIGGIGINGHQTKAQNIQNGTDPDGTSGILVITQDGKEAIKGGSSILGTNEDPINKYYAYGIWNSFGIDFDPVTGKLWDTENGVVFGDEINLVEPGFNSGWNKIDGIWLRGYAINETESHVAPNNTDNLLVDFDGKGKYSLPEFTWFDDVGPTAIKFLSSDKLGKQYENDMFVGDIINGNLYHFELNEQRTELLFSPNSPLADKVVSSYDNKKLDEIIIGKGFGGITDMQIGPRDGYLYILTFDKTQGTIYRISPTTMINVKAN
jgi:glucose/arabinose dehydrogenase